MELDESPSQKLIVCPEFNRIELIMTDFVDKAMTCKKGPPFQMSSHNYLY